MNPWPKYITLYKKKHVRTFLPLLAVSSGEAVSGTGAGVYVLAGWFTPSFPSLCLHGCVSCSDSRFPGTRFLGGWNSASPPSISSLPFPWERGPSRAWLPTACPSGVSGLHLGLLGSWRCRLAVTAVRKVSCLLGSFCGPSLVSLLPLRGHLLFLSPLAFLYPSQ